MFHRKRPLHRNLTGRAPKAGAAQSGNNASTTRSNLTPTLAVGRGLQFIAKGRVADGGCATVRWAGSLFVRAGFFHVSPAMSCRREPIAEVSPLLTRCARNQAEPGKAGASEIPDPCPRRRSATKPYANVCCESDANGEYYQGDVSDWVSRYFAPDLRVLPLFQRRAQVRRIFMGKPLGAGRAAQGP